MTDKLPGFDWWCDGKVDPNTGLTSSRLDTLMPEDCDPRGYQHIAKMVGVEIAFIVLDDAEEAMDAEPDRLARLRSEVIAGAKPPEAGMVLVSSWETEDGEIVCAFGRPCECALAREEVK